MEHEIKKILSAVLDIPVTDIDQNTSSDTVTTWDSLHHMKLIMALESNLGCSFNDAALPKMISFEAIVEQVKLQTN